MSRIDSPKSKALLILFEGFNTLDVNGPLEVFRKSGNAQDISVTVAAQAEITTSTEGAHMKRDIALDEALLDSLSTYDLLIVPGGRALSDTDPVQKTAADRDGLFMKLIRDFSQLPTLPGQNPRTLLVVCTGAIFVANLGIFNDLYCTTHWGIYSTLAKYLEAGAEWGQGKPGTLLESRYVDPGVNSHGVRIISTGGSMCGVDASLHIVRTRYGQDEAIHISKLLDYGWTTSHGVVFGGKF